MVLETTSESVASIECLNASHPVSSQKRPPRVSFVVLGSWKIRSNELDDYADISTEEQGILSVRCFFKKALNR